MSNLYHWEQCNTQWVLSLAGNLWNADSYEKVLKLVWKCKDSQIAGYHLSEIFDENRLQQWDKIGNL